MFDMLGIPSKFEKLAEEATTALLEDGVSLNDSIEKIAKDKDLNPEEIKRVVEAANVKAFQKNFECSERKGHKDVDFDVADPQVIIRRIYVIKGEKSAPKKTEDKDSGLDFLANLGDLFHHKPERDAKVKDLEVPDSLTTDRPTLIIRVKTAKANFEKEAYIAADEFYEKTAAYGKQFRVCGTALNFEAFCKTANEHLGSDCHAILAEIAKSAKKTVPAFEVAEMTKVAGYRSQLVDDVVGFMTIASEAKRYETAIEIADKVLKEIQ